MRLRYEEPHNFDVSNGENSSDSKEFKSICIILNDALNLYLDSTEKSDILSVRKGFDFKEYEEGDSTEKSDILSVRKGFDFKEYEEGRLYNLQKSIWQVFDLYSIGQDKMSERELDSFMAIKPCLESLHQNTICFKNQLNSDENTATLWETASKMTEDVKEILKCVKEVSPTYNSRYLEWTDAGPGVGIPNYDVKFRIAQRIINLDYFIRLHLSNSDSSQNEVERCQRYTSVMQFVMEGL